MRLFERLRRHAAEPVPDEPVGPPTAAQLVARGRRAEALAMGPEGVQAVVDELDQLLELETYRIRGRQDRLSAAEVKPVVSALAEAHEPLASAALARALDGAVGADAPFTAALLEGLVRDGSDAALTELVEVAVHGRDDALASRAAGALVAAAAPGATPLAVSRLADADAGARARAASLVARLDPSRAVELLAPLLGDVDPTVRERAAVALGELGDEAAVLPLLVAEEVERRAVRTGLSAVTFSGRVSPYQLAVGEIVTGDPTLRWELQGELGYDAEARLEALVGPALQARSDEVRAATAGTPEGAPPTWTAAAVEDLLTRGSVLRRDLGGAELSYLDAKDFVTDRERCRRLGLEVGEASGESHTTVYGEKTDWVATVACTDGGLRLVVDREDLRRTELHP